MPCYAIDGMVPVVMDGTFVHPTASIIGDVIIHPGCYIGPHASLRGDFGRIVISEGSNVQDACTLHSFPGKEVSLAAGSHIGHGAVVHGARLEQNVLVGMNAVVMDDVVIGANSFVAAQAFVKAGTVVPADSLVAGLPAKVIKNLTPDQIRWKSQGTKEYQQLAARCLASFAETAPLRAVPADRGRLDVSSHEPAMNQRELKPKKGTQKR